MLDIIDTRVLLILLWSSYPSACQQYSYLEPEGSSEDALEKLFRAWETRKALERNSD